MSSVARPLTLALGGAFVLSTIHCQTNEIGDLPTVQASCGAPLAPQTATCGNGMLDAGEFCIAEAGQSFAAPSARFSTRNLAAGDFNGDGQIDLVVKGNIFENLGGAFSAQAVATIRSGNTIDFDVGDINGDGITDLATAEFAPNPGGMGLGEPALVNEVHVYLGSPDWQFARATVGPLPGYLYMVRIADFNGDGAADLLPSASGGDVAACDARVLLREANGTFTEVKVLAGAGPGCAVAPADIDGDHVVDVCVAGAIGIDHGLGDGQFLRQPSLPRPNTHTAKYGHDLDCDGVLDAVATNSPTRGLEVWHGEGKDVFTRVAADLASSAVYNLDVGDLNLDGEPDIAAVGDGALRIFFGDVDAMFAGGDKVVAASWSSEVLLADLNADGALDIVFLADDTVQVWFTDI